MRTLAVEFVEPPHWRRWMPAAILAAGLAGAGLLCLEAMSKRQERVMLQAERAAWRDQRLTAAAEAGRPASAPPYAVQAWQIVKIQSFDIDAVLRTIERARQPGVRVNSLEIDPENRQANLELEANDRATAAAYVEDLNAGLAIPLWILTRAHLAAETGKLTARVEYRP